MCKKGEDIFMHCQFLYQFLYLVTCQLHVSQNEVINCPHDGVYYYNDTCSFTCNTGYELTGSDTRTCQGDGSWSGVDSTCRKGIYKCSRCL